MSGSTLVTHLGLHFPSLPAALGFGWIQAAIHVDMVYAVPVHSLPIDPRPIQGFAIECRFAVDSIPIHLHQ
ncbi:hypothetical protein INR49_030872, partial [Caranx melampygus]